MNKGIDLLGKFLINYHGWQVREILVEGCGEVEYATYYENGGDWVHQEDCFFRKCGRGHILSWGRILTDEEVAKMGLTVASKLREQREPQVIVDKAMKTLIPLISEAPASILISVLESRGYAVTRPGHN
jgi:hypothetical protein